ncbi:transaldolase [Rathayibacter toxicus]|uniref:Transaldolase n=1 Tax=Rathayibacter toxicus TaxID=145458 RepID=A0A0C5BF82_9MICO|nr:transaldolase [Rathayibacter toxicus]AJM77719.1 transaldolase [Rathayibacter toxicus]ALS58116.1 transaldolase [Rathayibacter toxicus]KKM45325.1 transaldolase [Rathayibacter toxicus]PPG21851.1 transaldolase [Rathayibacter toxicus]PPG46813.1 transaldolase [Rathayibacter toxicus]
MTENTPTAQLSAAGVSIWLDDLSRSRISSGGLQKLIDEKNVVGVTTNPTIFAAALSHGESYDDQVRELAARNASVTEAVFEITTHDVAAAADIFRPIYAASNGYDGRVSIEVEPGLAHDAQGTIEQAKALWATINRPNVMIKIPATVEGLEAITAAIGVGISVNVTLIFSLSRYRAVINAYLAGLEKAKEAGIDLSTIHSVASFFVSRVDTEIDKRLNAIGTDEARALTSKAGLANARLAYEVFVDAFATERALLLQEAGANRQRPLWASTGVKSADLPDTLYVTELVTAGVVNTMPEKTLEATFDHATITGDTIIDSYADANAVLDDIAAQGISYSDVTELLEKEGVEKFSVSWNELLDTVTAALNGAKEQD